ncbi:MAG: HypC/HybG/HupF family hydrogenase formation chaperone [Bacteroidales bacterium]|nr:HypC/HybG/HupF family hydrogenase formation chaperone [Bacteroidales bacterium]
MCLSVPVRIIKINGDRAIAKLGETEVDISIKLVEDITEGDYVLVHTGMAIQKISEKHASETIELLEKLLDEEENTAIS